jgi:hypothetical protein
MGLWQFDSCRYRYGWPVLEHFRPALRSSLGSDKANLVESYPLANDRGQRAVAELRLARNLGGSATIWQCLRAT